MVLPVFRPCSFLAVAAALFAGGSPSLFASALDLTADTCEDLAALPPGTMTEDVTLSLGSDVFTCDAVTTVKADGPHAFTVNGGSSTAFNNVRFEASGGASLTFTSMLKMITSMTFSGVTELASDGGVLNVEHRSSATFMVMPTFQHNSVQAGYSGGVVHAGGEVSFPYMSYFNENAVVGSVDRPSGSGGALFVDHGGAVVFGDASVFTNNDVGGGGQGGAVANLGSLVFEGPSGQAMFSNNAAPEYVSAAGDASGGRGGAIFTGGSGVTSISGLQYASHNSAASGGALYNEGTTLLMSTTNASTTQFTDNDAQGNNAGNGGHIYTSGVVYAQDACDFTYGSATGNGGAVYIDDEGSFKSAGVTTYTSNTADGECDNVYVSGVDPVCQPASQAVPKKGIRLQGIHGYVQDGECDNVYVSGVDPVCQPLARQS